MPTGAPAPGTQPRDWRLRRPRLWRHIMAVSLRGFGACGTKAETAPFHATEQRRTEPAAGGRWHERRTNGPALRGQRGLRTPGSLRTGPCPPPSAIGGPARATGTWPPLSDSSRNRPRRLESRVDRSVDIGGALLQLVQSGILDREDRRAHNRGGRAAVRAFACDERGANRASGSWSSTPWTLVPERARRQPRSRDASWAPTETVERHVWQPKDLCQVVLDHRRVRRNRGAASGRWGLGATCGACLGWAETAPHRACVLVG